MESLNMYASDGESDSSSSMMVHRRSTADTEEIDANCEPITMDMSEDSSNGQSDHGADEQRDTNNVKRRYSKSLSTSPATSYSSYSSDSNKRSKGRVEDTKTDSLKSKRYNNDRRSKHDKDYRHEDERDRRRRDDKRDRRRDRDNDRYGAKKYERKRHRSRSRSSSHSRRNSRSYRPKNRSRSRSRSYDRHQRKNSPSRSNTRRRSPYRSRRSRSRTRTRSRSPRDCKQRPKNWKGTSKLKVLEKLGIELKVPPVVTEPPVTGSNPTVVNTPSQLTPQMLLQKTMEEQVEKVKSATGITLPSYYNPMAVNPTKYAEQIQKRRLLWGNKDKPANNPPPEEKKVILPETKGTGTIWQGATFGGDQDGKITAKFQRLMGIKTPGAAVVPETKKDGTDLIKKQEEMFNSMESQYEVARLATHTHRGVGLGFGTFQPR